jgi:hypothetical protein
MVEAAEIPVAHKTSKHKTAGNSTYTSSNEAVDAGPDQESQWFTVFKLTKAGRVVNHL